MVFLSKRISDFGSDGIDCSELAVVKHSRCCDRTFHVIVALSKYLSLSDLPSNLVPEEPVSVFSVVVRISLFGRIDELVFFASLDVCDSGPREEQWDTTEMEFIVAPAYCPVFLDPTTFFMGNPLTGPIFILSSGPAPMISSNSTSASVLLL